MLDIHKTSARRRTKGVCRIDKQERFAAMYRQYDQRLLGYALRRAPVEAAQDAVADAFLAAWRRFDELPKDAFPWLIEATRRTLANHRRASARQAKLAERLEFEQSAHLPSFLAGTVEEGPATAALRRLRSDDREALALIAWEGLTPVQAARSLGCSAVAFRVRLHRARHRLERALAEIDETQTGPRLTPRTRPEGVS